MESALTAPASTRVDQPDDQVDAVGAKRLAVVVNPSKFDRLDDVKEVVAKVCQGANWDQITWYEASKEDPGEGQARQALADGATVVCSLGGDGTVRGVASALVDTGIALGLLPGGTGNLLARNLELPVDDLSAALEVVLAGNTRKVDVGVVTWDDEPEQVFLVMAGMGMDARTMDDADERIKNAVGWPAYVLSGVKALFDPGFAVRASTHDHQAKSQRARMVVVGNCGQLTGGLELMPDARLDDGKLDVVVVAPSGILGWVAVVRDLITARRSDHRDLRRFASAWVDVAAARPILAQLDGDAVGPRQRMSAQSRPGVLLVTVPADEG
ncbi:MAG: diacylglycerol kinase family protein [Micropruina sp.]|nr:diacylglycerol kinase family lipid kinase [Micropruina sp.]